MIPLWRGEGVDPSERFLSAASMFKPVGPSRALPTEINYSFDSDADYIWRTLDSDGAVSDWAHVRSLIDQVGFSFEQTYLVVLKRGDHKFAQCCGNPQTGLIVEVSSNSAADVVIPKSAKLRQGHLITNLRWPYFADLDELHSPSTAMEIFYEWLVHGRILDGMERRFRWGKPGNA